MKNKHIILVFILVMVLASACGAPIDKEPPYTPPAPIPDNDMINHTNDSPDNKTLSNNTKNIADYGAIADGITDDTLAIQKALDSLEPGDTLLFNGGTHIYSDKLLINTTNVTLQGRNTTLLAANEKQALWIASPHVKIIGFNLISDFDLPRTAEPIMSHIVVDLVEGVVIKDNYIEGGRETGMMIFGGRGIVIENNIVKNTKSDGIHLTDGTKDGLVANNTVIGTGDDGIAVVSYMVHGTISRKITIENNNVSSTTWGRGITVVGGEDVIIRKNNVYNTSAAGIYLASEWYFNTYGVRNVIIDSNNVSYANYLTEVDNGGILTLGESGTGIYKGEEIDLMIHNVTIKNNIVSYTISGPAHIRNVFNYTRNLTVINNTIIGRDNKKPIDLMLEEGYIRNGNTYNGMPID
ncbi:MAG: right-handed parallel beta-helix repeat-containing protein [Candidatus Woesearchaeota archaeon]